MRAPKECLVLIVLLLFSTSCYTAQELRKKAESMPDPRQAEMDILWSSILSVAEEEEGWPLELARRDDLFLTTEWMEVEDGLRKRVRINVVLAPMGFGLNVLVKHQRRDESAPFDSQWKDFSSPSISEAQKAQEADLVRRIHAMWQSRR